MGTVEPLTDKNTVPCYFYCTAEGMLTVIPTLQVQCGFLRYNENCAPFLFHSL